MHNLIVFVHTHPYMHVLIVWVKIAFQILFLIFTLTTVIGSQVALPESAYRGTPCPDVFQEDKEKLAMGTSGRSK